MNLYPPGDRQVSLPRERVRFRRCGDDFLFLRKEYPQGT